MDPSLPEKTADQLGERVAEAPEGVGAFVCRNRTWKFSIVRYDGLTVHQTRPASQLARFLLYDVIR